FCPEPGKQVLEVLVGSRGVTHLEADGAADLHHIADHDCALLPVGADYAADEEVATLVFLGVLIHRDTDMQALRDSLPILDRKLSDDLLEFGQRRHPSQLPQHVSLGLGNDHRRTEGPAALADNRANRNGTAEHYSDRAARHAVPIEEKAAASWTTGEAANQWQYGGLGVGPLQEFSRGEGEGISEQYRDGVVIAPVRHSDNRWPIGRMDQFQPHRRAPDSR